MAHVPTTKQNPSLPLKTVISLLDDCLRERGVYGHPHVIPCNTAAGQKFTTQGQVSMSRAVATPLSPRLLAQALRRELCNSINLFPEINYSTTLAM